MWKCGILVPRPGIEPAPLALEAQSLNHWTAREVPKVTTSMYETLRKIIISLSARSISYINFAEILKQKKSNVKEN